MSNCICCNCFSSIVQVLDPLPQAPKCGRSDPFFYHLELAGKEKIDDSDDRKSPNAVQGGPLLVINGDELEPQVMTRPTYNW